MNVCSHSEVRRLIGVIDLNSSVHVISWSYGERAKCPSNPSRSVTPSISPLLHSCYDYECCMCMGNCIWFRSSLPIALRSVSIWPIQNAKMQYVCENKYTIHAANWLHKPLRLELPSIFCYIHKFTIRQIRHRRSAWLWFENDWHPVSNLFGGYVHCWEMNELRAV